MIMLGGQGISSLPLDLFIKKNLELYLSVCLSFFLSVFFFFFFYNNFIIYFFIFKSRTLIASVNCSTSQFWKIWCFFFFFGKLLKY
jgi:hypothetical protein